MEERKQALDCLLDRVRRSRAYSCGSCILLGEGRVRVLRLSPSVERLRGGSPITEIVAGAPLRFPKPRSARAPRSPAGRRSGPPPAPGRSALAG